MSAVRIFFFVSTIETVIGAGSSCLDTLATRRVSLEGSKANPLGKPPTFTFSSFPSRPYGNTPTVFSPRLEVNTKSFSLETSTPATLGRLGIERSEERRVGKERK